MFKFLSDDDDNPHNPHEQEPPSQPLLLQQPPSKEILVNDFHFKLASSVSTTTHVHLTKSLRLKCVDLKELINNSSSSNSSKSSSSGGGKIVLSPQVITTLNSSSDLESGVYEGGFKTWECTYDLGSYVQEQFENIVVVRGGGGPFKVLDLGCGSGLLGLGLLKIAEQRGVDIEVDFQDYNEDVITHVTIPNALLNFNDSQVAKCRFYCGDWGCFANHLQALDKLSSGGGGGTGHYDMILSSETIYNLEYFHRFIRVLDFGLRERASLYLAAKTFYFGVGGGTRAFVDKIKQYCSCGDARLNVEVVRAIKDGVHREILRVWKT